MTIYQSLTREYSGIMIRGIGSSLNPLNVSYALRQMKGGVRAFDTGKDLLSFIIFYKHIRNNAYESTSGVIKRMTTSKTMNVTEIVTLYETLRTIIKHFEASIKNKEILEQALEILQLSQVHLFSRCQAQMGHFLKTCSLANDELPAIYHIMATCNIRQDERDSLFTVQSVYLLKLMTCFEKPFMEAYLRQK